MVTRLRERRTRIVATLGPATSDPPAVAALVGAGVDVVRLNLSHGDHETHARAAKAVRTAAAEADRHVALLADLCGPKIRVGRFPGGRITLTAGEQVVVTTRDVPGAPGLIPSRYPALHEDVEVGCRVLLDDGLLELRVDAVDGPDVTCTVVHGGVLADHKGITLPDVEVSAPALTDKDRTDARFAVELGVDLIALSFVSAAADIHQLRELLPPSGGPLVIAKIERPQGVTRIAEILDAADGIMVARGDLGVELDAEEVPVIQRMLVTAARRQAKPVIVATQMLESMITNPRPTRAEVSDVSTAVFAGADAVMLSGETAVGAHPLAAVAMMDRIARRVESHQWEEGTFRVDELDDARLEPLPLGQAVSAAVAQLSRDLRVRAIVVVTDTPATAALIAASRPAAPVLTVTAEQHVARQVVLLWSVIPVLVGPEALHAPADLARRVVTDRDLATAGQHLLLVTGLSGGGGETAPTVTAMRL